MADYYFGHGDETKNARVKFEIPLLSERFAYGIWVSFLEYYQVSEELSAQRGMPAGSRSGISGGDFYVQTRINLLKEGQILPDLILNTTLKTASAKETDFHQRRLFDTPGYYFDIEAGKSIETRNKFIKEIRFVGDLGFLCWETTSSRQDDAPMYGAKIIAKNQIFKLENTISGYHGWMHTNQHYGSNFGDAPLIYAAKVTLFFFNLSYFMQYQYGIKDYPYNQVRAGASFKIP